jgi:L-threonylcarbamoyladenylate synthase
LNTVIKQVNPATPDPEEVRQAAEILHAGGLVAFPTETVYGLGANALESAAVARIFAAKGRPANNPLIVHVADSAGARGLAADWPWSAEQLAERYWPGPLTLVVARSAVVPDIVTAGGPTVAVRVPAHPVARALLSAATIPLAAPSANRSTRLSPTRAEHVLYDLDGRIDLILDAGPTPGGLESTVLDVTTKLPRLLRPGLIDPGEITAVIGPIVMAGHTPSEPLVSLPAPGMSARHYAPRAALQLAADSGWDIVFSHCRAGRRVGWLTFERMPEQRHSLVSAVVMPDDPAAYAAQLYDVLHRLDTAGVERMVVALPPDTEAWLAVRDRLRRAAAS